MRLPKEFGICAGEGLELVQKRHALVIRRVDDPVKEKAELSELVRILLELGPIERPLSREPVEFPDRPGLY